MSARAFVAGAALAGAGVTLFGCGGSDGGGGGGDGGFTCTKSATVQEAWDNHFGAFGDFNLDKIMCDYDDTSVIAVLNDKCGGVKADATKRSGYSEYKGKAAIRGFFDALFTQLGKNGDNLDKVGPVTGDAGPASVIEGQGANGNVFLTWRTKLTGDNAIAYATDSFSFRQVDGQSLIWKQNIVTTEPNKECPDGGAPSATNGDAPLYTAWGNHFGAFAAGVANPATEAWNESMSKEYDENSVVQVFDTRTESYNKYTGWPEIEGMFTALFAAIDAGKTASTDKPLEDAGVAVLLQEITPAYQDVFLAWEANSHPKATDTFVFNAAGDKIVRQNIVVATPGSSQTQVMV